jgi:hypothetical protein
MAGQLLHRHSRRYSWRPDWWPFASNGFKGVAIDADDPPMFESQAAYLKRHGLLLAGEERRLKKADWKAEITPRME